MHKVNKILISNEFWRELGALKGKEAYQRIRKGFAGHSLKVLQGKPHGFSPLTNPVFKGLTHLSISSIGMAIFAKFDGSTLFVLGVVEHSDYGFNRKNGSRERTTAEKMNERAMKTFSASPNWSNFKWNQPVDIIESKELHEYSLASLNQLKEELDLETLSLWKFNKHIIKSKKSNCLQVGQHWVEDILKADELVSMHISRLCKEMCIKGSVHYDHQNFRNWIDENEWNCLLLAA